MYTKEEIVAEIKRVAEYLRVDTLTSSQFQECSTIPLNTVEFFLGSWAAALREAQLTGRGRKDPTSKDLLSELWRIHQKTGEVPTYSLIDQFGHYPSAKYRNHWRNLEDPFKLAQKYFGVEQKSNQRDGYQTDVGRTRMFGGEAIPGTESYNGANEDEGGGYDPQDLEGEMSVTIVSAPVPDFAKPDEVDIIEQLKSRPSAVDTRLNEEPVYEKTLSSWPSNGDDEGLLLPDYHAESQHNDQPVLIPDLANEPAEAQRLKGERLNFRGLQFPPADRNGVVFLFGMVANELGFFLETIGDTVGFIGYRTHRLDQTEWSTVRLHFAHHSSELIGKESELKEKTHLACWEHDWMSCPLPVVNLSLLIQELPNYKRPK